MKVGVIGVGYVGLVTAACFADSGTDVICVDNDQGKIRDLNDGVIPIYEPGLTEIVKRARSTGRLHFTTSLTEAVDESLLLFLAVGTPSADDGSADVSAVLDVATDIAEATNVADDHPDVVSRLEELVQQCREDLGDGITGTEGKNRRPVGRVENPKPLAYFDENHPYLTAMYDIPNAG